MQSAFTFIPLIRKNNRLVDSLIMFESYMKGLWNPVLEFPLHAWFYAIFFGLFTIFAKKMRSASLDNFFSKVGLPALYFFLGAFLYLDVYFLAHAFAKYASSFVLPNLLLTTLWAWPFLYGFVQWHFAKEKPITSTPLQKYVPIPFMLLCVLLWASNLTIWVIRPRWELGAETIGDRQPDRWYQPKWYKDPFTHAVLLFSDSTRTYRDQSEGGDDWLCQETWVNNTCFWTVLAIRQKGTDQFIEEK